MKFDGSDFYAALIHELKNNLGLLSMTINSIPMLGEPAHDEPVDSARLLCQEVVDRLKQALLIYKASNQPIRPNIDAYSPHDLVDAIKERAEFLSCGRLRIEAMVAPDVPAIWFFDRDLIEMALIKAMSLLTVEPALPPAQRAGYCGVAGRYCSVRSVCASRGN